MSLDEQSVAIEGTRVDDQVTQPQRSRWDVGPQQRKLERNPGSLAARYSDPLANWSERRGDVAGDHQDPVPLGFSRLARFQIGNLGLPWKLQDGFPAIKVGAPRDVIQLPVM